MFFLQTVLNAFFLAVFWAVVIDRLGFFQRWKKPFSCVTCMTFWTATVLNVFLAVLSACKPEGVDGVDLGGKIAMCLAVGALIGYLADRLGEVIFNFKEFLYGKKGD
ncbi:MAG: hypothetical protein MdMp024_0027 [Bacteroidales bacterium]